MISLVITDSVGIKFNSKYGLIQLKQQFDINTILKIIYNVFTLQLTIHAGEGREFQGPLGFFSSFYLLLKESLIGGNMRFLPDCRLAVRYIKFSGYALSSFSKFVWSRKQHVRAKLAQVSFFLNNFLFSKISHSRFTEDPPSIKIQFNFKFVAC